MWKTQDEFLEHFKVTPDLQRDAVRMAISQGDVESLEELFVIVPDLLQSLMGEYRLISGIEFTAESWNVIRALLGHGWKFRGNDKSNAIHAAVRVAISIGDVESIEKLCVMVPDLIQSIQGTYLLSAAIEYTTESWNVIRALLDRGWKMRGEDLFDEIDEIQDDILDRYLTEGEDLNTCQDPESDSPRYHTLLHRLVELWDPAHGQTDDHLRRRMDKLIKHGMDVNQGEPIELAIGWRHEMAAIHLLSRGARIAPEDVMEAPYLHPYLIIFQFVSRDRRLPVELWRILHTFLISSSQ
jgi:hypothetical protein